MHPDIILIDDEPIPHGLLAEDQPAKLSEEEQDRARKNRFRIRQAAMFAIRLYPNPIGELVQAELLAWHDLGYRFSSGSGVLRLVEFLENANKEKILREITYGQHQHP